MSNTPIDTLLRLVGDQYPDEVLEALAQAWQEGYDHPGAFMGQDRNPYIPVRYL